MKIYQHMAAAIAATFMGLPHPSIAAEPAPQQMAMLEILADKQELYELNLRYARAVDRKNFDNLRALYAPDAIHDHGGMFKGSPDQFVAWLTNSMVDIETQHLVANSLFHVTGDTATGEIYTINFHYMPKLSLNYIAGGRYLDHYVKVNGAWHYQSRLRVIDWSEERPASIGETAANLVKGTSGTADPSHDFGGFQ